ncbi:hypothetical protein IFR10_05955 [Bacillus sp. CFBP 13597]|nr:hypothetical protein [Bacillus sp. CFBP 13597]
MKNKFVVKQMKIQDLVKGTLTPSYITFICVENKVTGMLYPHPLSNFIKSVYGRKSSAINTQKSYAEGVKKFLNYILESIEEDETFIDLFDEGISGLRLQHGADYLSYLTHRVSLGEIKPERVYEADRILTKFFSWLIEQEWIKEKVRFREEIRNIKGKNVTIMISPFDNFELGTEYPNKRNNKKAKDRRLHDFGNGRLDLVELFLRVAELVSPDIALGIAFQFFGGLRKAEVVNLLRSSVKEPKKNGSGEFTLNIKDNWQTLFENKKLTVSEQVKKERIQAVIKVPIVLELYEKHKEHLSRLERRGKLKNTNALFCSIHTGKPISGMAYWERFTNVKEKFLEVLLDYDEDAYKKLTSKAWSTHIGRGIFTNMLVFLLGWNVSEVAVARGDSNIQSSQDYIEEQNVKKRTEEAIEILAAATRQVENEKYMKIENLREFVDGRL